MLKSITLLSSSLVLLLFVSLDAGEKWWQKWDNYPKVPRVTAKQVKSLILAKEKTVFIYSGYQVKEVVCGSFYIPYTLVPPNSDGSKIKLKIPKDYWIMCYCP